MSDERDQAPGFFGKVRTHGDFVARRLPAEFIVPWDEGLQAGMLSAQQRFGTQWLAMYLNAPVWCFALGAGCYGEAAWSGVLMPGVDRVGRYFPFTIARAMDGDTFAGRLAHAQAWYDSMTQLALATLAPDFDLDAFDAALCASGQTDDGGEGTQLPWRLHVADSPWGSFVDLLTRVTVTGHGIWWSEGSPALLPSARLCNGALDGDQFASLLDRGEQEWSAVIDVAFGIGDEQSDSQAHP